MRIRSLLFITLFGLFLTATLACCGGDSKGHGGGSCSDGKDSCGMGMDGLMTMRDNLKAYWEDVRGKPFKAEGKVRKYYIRADEVVWDYAPGDINGVTGEPYTPAEAIYTVRETPYWGSQFIKCIYQEYTDRTFTKLKKRSENEQYMGLLGPTIRGEVGDTIKIEFRNACKFPNSMHPHGVFYNKDSEGAPYEDGTFGRDKGDDAVPTGGSWTYHWLCPERAGPASMDGSSAMWMYHSHTDESVDVQSGLMGFIIVTAKGMANPDGTPFDVDQEVFMNYQIFDERQSHYFDDNFAKFGTTPTIPTVGNFGASLQKHTINGYLYATGPYVKLKQGSRVRWNIMSMDLHTPHWHGNTFVTDGMRMDVIGLLFAEMKVVDMVPDNVGLWLYHCHVPFHFQGGMITKYEVVEKKKYH